MAHTSKPIESKWPSRTAWKCRHCLWSCPTAKALLLHRNRCPKRPKSDEAHATGGDDAA
jgi:hypothetical protein